MIESYFLLKRTQDLESQKFIKLTQNEEYVKKIDNKQVNLADLHFSSLNRILKKLLKLKMDDFDGKKYRYVLLKPFQDISKIIMNELTSSAVTDEIERLSDDSVCVWLNEKVKSYFEVTINPDKVSKLTKSVAKIDIAVIRTIIRNIEMFLIYFSNTFFVVLNSAEDQENKLNIKNIPNVSSRGAGIHIKTYDVLNDFGFMKLTVWNSNIDFKKVLETRLRKSDSEGLKFVTEIEVINEMELVSKASDSFKGGYCQTYILSKRGVVQTVEDTDNLRKALFQYGKWCYEGEVTIDTEITLHNVPKILRQFQQQQNKLRFTYETKEIPLSHSCQIPLSSLTLVCSLLKEYILKSEPLLEELENLQRKRNSNPWIDVETGKQYFELQVTQKYLNEYFQNIEFLATKIYYHEVVFIVVLLAESSSFYVTLNQTRGDQPLLDLSFPDVSSKNRGYLLYSFNHLSFKKLMIWECETSVWQTSNKMVLNRKKKANEDVKSIKDKKVELDVKTSDQLETDKEEKDEVIKGVKNIIVKSKVGEYKVEEKTDEVKKSKLNKMPSIRAPHHVKSIGSLLKQKSLASLPKLSSEAPWDKFGRPKDLFKESKH